MNITRQTHIKEIKDHFQQTLPFLKLEIYDVKPEIVNKEIKRKPLSDQYLLSDLNHQFKNHEFNIDVHMEVGKFERMLLEKYNLIAQVFRQSAGVWLQTTATDHWSLEKQNSKGQHSVDEHDTPPLNVTDFDLI
ncbi:MAG: hypothetical protein IPO92_08265 [Saprospiraceae bacterium]|nr:hypothetical protein [Saprospiraceae bacterium]